MKNRMSVSRCCCGCEDCCNGSYPEEYEVEFSFTNNLCTTCADMDGIFTLSKVAGNNCNWQYRAQPISEGCDPPYGIIINERRISLSIRCYGDTQYKIDLEYYIAASYPCIFGTGSSEYQFFTFQKFINVADFACSDALNFSIPYRTRGRSIASWICSAGFPGAFYSVSFDWICDPGTEALLTAV